MSASTSGSTSSPHIKETVGCVNGVSWIRRVEINPTNLTTIQTIYINDVTNASQATKPLGWSAVPCEMGKDGEFTVHCDTNTIPPTPYIKRIVLDFSTTPITQTIQNFTLAGVAYTPSIEGVCDGYDLIEGCADIISTITGVITPVRSLQLTRFGQLIGTPVYYTITNNAVIVLTGSDRAVNCGSLSFTESLMCDLGATPSIPFWRTQIKMGSVVLFTENKNVAKTANYTILGVIGVCGDYTIDEEYACISDGTTGNNGTVSIRIVKVYQGSSTIPISEVRTRMDTYATVANNVPLVPCTVKSGTVRQGSTGVISGTGSNLIPAGKKSITLIVYSGAVTGSGSLQSGSQQYRAGTTESWSVTEAGELLEAMTFTGATATTQYTVIWTQLN
jgi:hypothetical protein